VSRPHKPRPAEITSKVMRAIRSTDNEAEVALRRAIHAAGYRYRKYCSGLPGKPDLIFAREQVAIFVDGDYWHARILQERGVEALEATLRTPNRDYWIKKFHRTVTRDKAANAALAQMGWTVIRLWESDIQKDVAAAAEAVITVVNQQRERN
jgi:DNA mismatch endonuclease, patch repair protein